MHFNPFVHPVFRPLAWRGVCLLMGVGMVACGEPKLRVTPVVYDLGRLTERQAQVPFAFVLKNVGTEKLEITRVRAFCGCTPIALAKNSLEPGEEVVLNGVLQTKGIEGATSKNIAISTNEPRSAPTFIRVSAHLPFSHQGLRLLPTTGEVNVLRFVGRGESMLRAVVQVQNCDADKVYHVTAVQLPEGWTVTSPLPAVVRPETSARIALVKTFENEPDSFAGLPFVVRTSHPETPGISGTLAYRRRR